MKIFIVEDEPEQPAFRVNLGQTKSTLKRGPSFRAQPPRPGSKSAHLTLLQTKLFCSTAALPIMECNLLPHAGNEAGLFYNVL
jgi:hypothetical protein